jgi:endonuclease/exonuclease/phosphatase family metal-dependent hydrolase
MTDTFLAVNGKRTRDDGTRHAFTGSRGGPRIDWIVTNNRFHTIDADIVHTRAGLRYPSDHFPVTAVLRPVVQIPVASVE